MEGIDAIHTDLGLLKKIGGPYDPSVKIDRAKELAEDKLERMARDTPDTVSFWREATDVLRAVIPFDFHPCWFTVDPATLLVTGHMNAGLDRTPPEIARAWYAEGDVNSPAELAATPNGATTVKAATAGDAVASWRWRNLLEPRGFDDSLDAVFRKGKTVWGAVNFLHGEGSRPFTVSDVEYIAKLSPLLATGTQLGLFRSEGSGSQSDGPAVLIVGADLVALSISENAERWLVDLPDIGKFSGNRLPIPIQVIVLRALEAADGTAEVRVRSGSGSWLYLRGSRLSGSGLPQVAVIVERATPDQIAPVRLAASGLTPREQQVVDLVLRGFSTREIASRLFISEYTVQDRLKSIFEKVGVRSRRELVAKIHKTDFAPIVDANDHRLKAGESVLRHE